MEGGVTETSSAKMHGGYNKRYKHYSHTLGCSMNFHIYFPPSDSTDSQKFPLLYWLSGLTCTDENFIFKSGAQRAASQHGVALIVPDTSPSNFCSSLFLLAICIICNAWWSIDSRYHKIIVTGGLNVEGEADSWDFGVGMFVCIHLRFNCSIL